jgi:predicted TPR repeat methyltransferase
MVKKAEINAIDVYDNLAEGYDEAIASLQQNVITRKFVREKVLSLTTAHLAALDFGGGTGLDIDWLSGAFEKVYFVEPSQKMREQAVERSRGVRNVVFTEMTDFRQWDLHTFNPAPSVTLANFAVLNSIVAIDEFFEVMATCMGPDALIFALVLDSLPGRLPLVKRIAAMFRRRNGAKSVVYHGKLHNTIVHPERRMKTAAGGHFEVTGEYAVENSSFILYLFRRK